MMIKKNQASSNLYSVAIIGVLFFIFGFVTWLNSTLIPFLKISCELTNAEAYLVTFAFYISYFVMALPSSFLLYKTGYKKGMALGLMVMAIGTFLFLRQIREHFGFFLQAYLFKVQACLFFKQLPILMLQ
jgi:MFS transporter, FHS family, L-fucose permease